MPPDRSPPDRGRAGVVRRVTSLANPEIKQIRGLALPKNRKQSGLFIAEGLKLVADAVETGWEVATLVYGGRAAEQPLLGRLAAGIHARGGSVIEATDAVLAKITRRDNPQMVVGVIRQRLAGPPRADAGAGALCVALEGVRDPGNLGTILRTIDAVGGAGAILVGATVDPFSIEAVRATMGSIFHVPLARMTTKAFLDWRRSWPGTVVGTHLAGTVDYRAGGYRDPVLLVMGGEQAGLTGPVAEACDRLVRIPMAGRADSLNLAVATGVILYEISRDRLPAGPGQAAGAGNG
jgi:TrmH family RNA methyltransferase